MAHPNYPPMQPGYPPLQPGYPPMQPVYPLMPQSGYPPMPQPGYPPMGPLGYPLMHSNDPTLAPMQHSYPMYHPGQAAPLPDCSMQCSVLMPVGAPAPAPTVQRLTTSVIVAGPQFSLPYATKLTMKGKNFMKLTAGNFEIYDSEDKLVLKVKGTFGLGTRRVLVDGMDNPIMTIKKKFITTRERWVAYRGKSINSSNKLFSIRAAKLIQFKEKYNVYMAGNTGEDVPDFRVKGSFIDRSCQIFVGNSDNPIARMDEKYNARTVILGKDIFGIKIEPNADYAFVIAIIVIANELDKSSHSNNKEDEEDDDEDSESDSSNDD